MPSAGELLRCERLKQNRSLSEIASETCISARYLQAIEEDNGKVLPGGFFHRSYIRQYAKVLQLGERETQEILDVLGPAEEIDPLPVFNIPQQIAEVEQASKPLAQIPTRVAVILLFTVLFGCSGLYALWSRAQEAADPAMRVQPIPGADEDSAAVTTAAHADAGKLDVNLAATEKTWISLSSEGRTVYSGVLDPSESKRFAIADRGRLLTGNAAGLDLRINGRALGPLGSRGQVRLVLLHQDNFEILSPPEM